MKRSMCGSTVNNIWIASLALMAVVLPFFTGCGGADSNINYVAIGASDAAGIGAEPLSKGYVFQIDDRLAASAGGVDLINLGIPGAEADEFVSLELPIAKESSPDLITIWAGLNDMIDGDSVEQFDSRLEELLGGLVEKTNAFIAIATIPDLSQLPRFIENPDIDVTSSRVSAFNDIIRKRAAQFGATIVDLSQLGVDEKLVSDQDGFHPSNAGHTLIADLFLKVIEPVFVKSRSLQ